MYVVQKDNTSCATIAFINSYIFLKYQKPPKHIIQQFSEYIGNLYGNPCNFIDFQCNINQFFSFKRKDVSTYDELFEIAKQVKQGECGLILTIPHTIEFQHLSTCIGADENDDLIITNYNNYPLYVLTKKRIEELVKVNEIYTLLIK